MGSPICRPRTASGSSGRKPRPSIGCERRSPRATPASARAWRQSRAGHGRGSSTASPDRPARPAGEMAVVQSPGAAAVEGDGDDLRVGVEQPVDRVGRSRRIVASALASRSPCAHTSQRAIRCAARKRAWRRNHRPGSRRTARTGSARTDCADAHNTADGAAILRRAACRAREPAPAHRRSAENCAWLGLPKKPGRGPPSRDETAEPDCGVAPSQAPRRHDQHAIVIGRADLRVRRRGRSVSPSASALRGRGNRRRIRNGRS